MCTPYITQFSQPDSIIPNLYNPQDWNRYSYARNNPLRYTDPSGHVSCTGSNWDDGPQCFKSTSIQDWKDKIQRIFGINMKDSSNRTWSLANLKTAYTALNMINDKLDGKLKAMVGGSTFIIADHKGDGKYYGATHLDGSGVTFHVADSGVNLPTINFLHETGHLLDLRPATKDVFSDPFRVDKGGATPTWVKDGYVNGDLLGNLFTQPVQAKPLGEHDSPDEYWADAFANYVAGNINVNEPTGAGMDMYNYVHDALQPYILP